MGQDSWTPDGQWLPLSKCQLALLMVMQVLSCPFPAEH